MRVKVGREKKSISNQSSAKLVPIISKKKKEISESSISGLLWRMSNIATLLNPLHFFFFFFCNLFSTISIYFLGSKNCNIENKIFFWQENENFSDFLFKA
jgi:hypothetical protein